MNLRTIDNGLFDKYVGKYVYLVLDLLWPRVEIVRPYWDVKHDESEAPKVDRSNESQIKNIGGKTFVNVEPTTPEANSETVAANHGNIEGRVSALTNFDFDEIDESLKTGVPAHKKLNVEKYRVIKFKWAKKDSSNEKVSADLTNEFKKGYSVAVVARYTAAMVRALEKEKQPKAVSID